MMIGIVINLSTHSGVIGGVANTGTLVSDQMDNIKDIREYDVPYHVRVAIDNKINAVSIACIVHSGRD